MLQDADSLAWPECVRRNVVVNGFNIGDALMVDLSSFGAKAPRQTVKSLLDWLLGRLLERELQPHGPVQL